MEHIESNTKIYFTNDYGRFKFLRGNRDVNEAKIEKIKQDIEDGIDILKYAPIIVNDNMEILDGQHRYMVARLLKTNVYYVINKYMELKGVTKINSRSTTWRTSDFLNSFVDQGMTEYKKLEAFRKKWPKITLSIAIKLLRNGTLHSDKDKTAMEEFKEGQFVATAEDEVTELCLLLQDFEPYMDNPYGTRMIKAMLKLKDSPKYQHLIMLDKLDQSKRRIEEVNTPNDIINNMEAIYNHKARERKQII